MIGTLRKHQQWFWWVVIAGTVVSFVYAFSPSSRYSSGSSAPVSAGNEGTIFGEPVTEAQWQAALNEAKIYYRLQANEWPTTQVANERVQDIARTFLLVDAELRHNHIVVTPDAAARFTKQMVGLKPSDPLTKDMLEQVLTKLLSGPGADVTANDFFNFVHLSAGQQYLTAIFGMTGQLITPNEAESFYRRDNEPMLVDVGLFPATNYVGMINPTANEINDFYAKREAQYRVPEKIALNYVEFPLTNYMAAADKSLAQQLGTNFDTKVDEIYVQQDPSSYRDETGTNILSPAAAKAKIKLEIRNRAALAEARKAAIEFANHLMEGHDDQHPFTTEDIFQVAKTNGLTVQSTPYFDDRMGPEGLDLTTRELRMVFSLRADDPDDKDRSLLYLTSPLVSDTGVYVIGLKGREPSHITPLDQIRAEVAEDYRESKALEMAHAAGQKFEEAAKAASAQSKTFAQLCQEEGVKLYNLPAFSLASNSIPGITNRTEAQQIESVAYSMPTGKMSPFIPTAEGGFVLFVRQRLPVDEAKMREQLPAMVDRLRQQRQVEAFTQWLNREGQLHAVFPRPDKTAGAG